MFVDCHSPSRRLGVEAALAAISAGDLVVMPTDTVYGIFANAFDLSAIRRLNRLRGRQADRMPPVAVGSTSTIDGLMISVPGNVRALIGHFWPGPLTLLVPHAPSLPWAGVGSNGFVHAQMPSKQVALELLQRTGPLAVISALPLAVEAPDARVVEGVLGEEVAVYLDEGVLPFIPYRRNTIVDCTGADPVVVRSGAVSMSRLQEVVPGAVPSLDGL